MKFRQSKGNNSALTDDAPIKLHTHNLIMAIYIQYKFHEIPSIRYLVMAEDGKSDGQRQTISLRLWWGIAKILITIGSLMKVESIAECPTWSILQYFSECPTLEHSAILLTCINLSDNWS